MPGCENMLHSFMNTNTFTQAAPRTLIKTLVKYAPPWLALNPLLLLLMLLIGSVVVEMAPSLWWHREYWGNNLFLCLGKLINTNLAVMPAANRLQHILTAIVCWWIRQDAGVTWTMVNLTGGSWAWCPLTTRLLLLLLLSTTIITLRAPPLSPLLYLHGV